MSLVFNSKYVKGLIAHFTFCKRQMFKYPAINCSTSISDASNPTEPRYHYAKLRFCKCATSFYVRTHEHIIRKFKRKSVRNIIKKLYVESFETLHVYDSQKLNSERLYLKRLNALLNVISYLIQSVQWCTRTA